MIDIVEFVEDYESNNCLRNEEYDCSDQKSCKDCIKEQIAKHDAEIREETKAEHDKECDTCILLGWKEKAEEIKRQARAEAISEVEQKIYELQLKYENKYGCAITEMYVEVVADLLGWIRGEKE